MESLEGFLFDVPSSGNLENALGQRHEKMSKYGLQNQPLTLIIRSAETISYQVEIETVRFVLPSVLEAIDFCFKSFGS